MNKIEHIQSSVSNCPSRKKTLGLSALFLICYSGLLLGEQPPIDKKLTIQKLRTYCQACHGLSELRFIKSENDEEMWETIFTEKSPKTGRLWVERIIAVLDWPTNSPPSFQDPIDAQSDWMPKGFKRVQLSQDFVEGVPVREIILETLKRGP